MDPIPIKNPEIKYTKLFINNEFVDAKDGKTFDVINPATCQLIAKVHEAHAVDVDLAVQAAKQAFDRSSEWRQMDASHRGELLFKLADLIERDIAYLASLESLNNGKPFNDAVGDMYAAIKIIKFYAGAADKIGGQVMPGDGNNLCYTMYEPVGICGAITPWNYPVMLEAIKLAPCLAMGNTMVLKPAEQTPLTALVLASLVKEAGFPPGVFNVIPGMGPGAGQPLVQHPDVNKISFTGSTEIGKLIQREAAATVKRVTLELGGKSPLIVLPDADLDHAAEVSHQKIMLNQGQCCIAASRTFVHEDIYDEFVKKSVEKAMKRKLGDPFEPDTLQGPQVDNEQFTRILNLIESGKKEGAKLECGGKRFGQVGYYVEPTVFSNVTDDMTIAKEEIFGPVQQILKFKTVDEAIKRANATNYGLGAGVFTKDLNTALYVTSRLNAGQVFVNEYFPAPIQAPFGGFKQSGIGRELGIEGLRQYYELKTVTIDLPFKII